MPFEMESLRALHIVLAAAFVGFLAFCASHAWACWSKRQQGRGTAQQRWPWPLIGLVGLVLIAAGWMDDHQLVRREGVIAGDSFHVVRAREDASATELPAAAGEVKAGQVLARFHGPAVAQQLQSAEAELRALEAQVAGAQLAPPEMDPGLSMARADARSEWQSLTSGLGLSTFAADGNTALRAQAEEADARLARLQALRAEGLVTLQDVEAARSKAVVAREALRLQDRGQALAGLARERMAQLEAAITQDRRRADVRREAQVRALADKLQDARARLAALQAQFEVRAPYDGRIVFRSATPDLVKAGEPVLALARGAGFRARVQIPAREVAALHEGQPLRLRPKQALVETTIVGRYAGGMRPAEDTGAAVIELLCDLPVEQFAQVAQGGVAVRLDWAPPLHANRIAQAGCALVLLAALLWLLQRLRAVRPVAAVRLVDPVAAPRQPAVAGSALAQQMHQLGVRLREETGLGHVSRETLTAIEWMMDRHPLLASRPLREGFQEAGVPWSLAAVLAGHDDTLRERLRRLLSLAGDGAAAPAGAGHAAAA